MKATLLGTGTSVGVPVIACDCPVCSSSDPRNRRRRTALYLRAEGADILVDTPPDFREQALEYAIPRIDAVLFTHSHADHIFGFDDIRRYNTIQDQIIPAYGNAETIADLRRVFNYIGKDHVVGFYRPRIEFKTVEGPMSIGALNILPLTVTHGNRPTLGYLFEEHGSRLGYVPDCSEMPDETVEMVKGVDVMILDALRHRPHRTHLTVENSVGLLRRIGAKQSYIIHMCHELDHAETEASLPPGIGVSYDGMTVEC